MKSLVLFLNTKMLSFGVIFPECYHRYNGFIGRTSLADLSTKRWFQVAQVFQAWLKAAVHGSKTVRIERIAAPWIVFAVALVAYYCFS